MTDRGVVLPFYLLIDVSYSMRGDRLAEAGLILPRIADALAVAPTLRDRIRLGLIDFSDDAQVVMPLCDVSAKTSLPVLRARGGTNYGAAFRLLRAQLEPDVTQLGREGFRVHRPAVFLLSDGAPDDDWRGEFRALTVSRHYPVIVPLGVAEADHDTLTQLVYPLGRSRLYMSTRGGGPAAVAAMSEVIRSSILGSGRSAALGGSGLVLPGPETLPAGLAVEDGRYRMLEA